MEVGAFEDDVEKGASFFIVIEDIFFAEFNVGKRSLDSPPEGAFPKSGMTFMIVFLYRFVNCDTVLS